VHAVGDDVDRLAHRQPDMAIDAGAFVPPAFHRLGIDSYGNRVELVTEARIGRQIDMNAVKTAPVAVDDRAVDPDRGVGGDRPEVDLEELALQRGIDRQFHRRSIIDNIDNRNRLHLFGSCCSAA